MWVRILDVSGDWHSDNRRSTAFIVSLTLYIIKATLISSWICYVELVFIISSQQLLQRTPPESDVSPSALNPGRCRLSMQLVTTARDVTLIILRSIRPTRSKSHFWLIAVLEQCHHWWLSLYDRRQNNDAQYSLTSQHYVWEDNLHNKIAAVSKGTTTTVKYLNISTMYSVSVLISWKCTLDSAFWTAEIN